MRTMALLGGRTGDSLHINREKIEISQVFIELLGFKGRSKFGRNEGNIRDRLITVYFLGEDC